MGDRSITVGMDIGRPGGDETRLMIISNGEVIYSGPAPADRVVCEPIFGIKKMDFKNYMGGGGGRRVIDGEVVGRE